MSIQEGLRQVFSRPRYTIYAMLIALSFYVVNVVIGNFRNLQTIYGLTGVSGATKMLGIFIVSFADTMPRFMYTAMIVISILTGVLTSLLIYRYDLTKTLVAGRSSVWASMGVFLGILAPGCASCGLGLIALLGLSSSIAFLPFQGNEIAFVSVASLTISTGIVSNSISKGMVCSFPIHIHERRFKQHGKRKTSV